MAHKAPGRSHRKGMTVFELLETFPDDDTAEKWFEEQRWPEGRFCPHCGSTNTREEKDRKPMPYRCKDCRGHFSVKHGTVMQSSPLGCRKWAVAIYLMATGIKGTASMEVYRQIGVRQATAWSMMHRIRESFDAGEGLPFPGPVEADETFIGGKRKNMSKKKRRELKEAGAGRGTVGKTAVVGVKNRETKEVRATVVPVTDTPHVAGFVATHTQDGAKVYTDEAKVYNALDPWFDHESVNHSVGEYVNDMAHTNGMESFWSLLKRGYHGTFHHISPEHLHRYVNEFAGRNNIRDLDTADQMSTLAQGMVGKRLKYADLTAHGKADNGLSNGLKQ